MAERYYTIDDLEKAYEAGAVTAPADSATSPVPAEAPATVILKPKTDRYYTIEELEKAGQGQGKWKPEEPQERATQSGYEPMVPAIIGRSVAGTGGGPIDFFNWADRAARLAVGEKKYVPPPPKVSAVQKFGSGLGPFDPSRYKPTDSMEKAVYDVGTAAVSSLAPYGVGLGARVLGAGAAMAGLPRVGAGLGQAGGALTYGGPIGSAAIGATSELGGIIGEEFIPMPKGEEWKARLTGNVVGGLGPAFALSGAKSGVNTLAARMPWNAETLADKTLVDKLGRSAIPDLEGVPGPPGLGPPPMQRTAEEVLSEARPRYSTGIASFDKYLRQKASKDPLTGENPYDAAARQRDVDRLTNVEMGTNVTGGATDPGIALAPRHTVLQTPTATEIAQQAAARAEQAKLPAARAATEAEESMGGNLNRWHSDSLTQQTTQADEVRRLLNDLDAHPNKLMQDFKKTVETRDPVTRGGMGGVDQTKYQNWMDKNMDKLTPDEQYQLMSIGAAHDELSTLTKQTQELAKQFPTTPGGTNAGLAKQYFKPGAEGAAAASKYKELTGGGDAEMGDLFDYGMAQFKAAPGALNADGSINSVALGKFRATHQGWLDQMPADLTKKLENYHEAQKLFDDTAAVRTQALKDFEESSIAPYLGLRSSGEAMNDLLTKGNRVDNIRGAMNDLKGNLPAQNGLRRNFIEHGAENHFMNKAADGSHTTFNPDGFQVFFRQNEDVIKELYGKPGYDFLKKVNDDIISQKDSMARLARVEAGAPKGFEGKLGKLAERATHYIGSKWSGLGLAVPSIGWVMFTGDLLSPAAWHAIQGGTGAYNVIRSQTRRGVQDATDRMAELMNNPKALALAMQEAPTNPSHPVYRRLASTLANAGTGVAAERLAHEEDAGGRILMMPTALGMVPRFGVGDRPR